MRQIVLATLIAAVLGLGAVAALRSSDAGGDGPPVVAHANYAHHYESTADLVELSDELVVGVVTAERAGSPYGFDDAPHRDRILTVRVEQALKGGPPATVEVETLGWVTIDGVERPLLEDGGLRLEVGDRALLALTVPDGGDPLRSVSGTQGVLLFAGGQVEDTPRTDPLVRELESLSESEVIATLAAS